MDYLLADYRRAQKACQHLNAAAKSMRVLSNLEWPDSYRQTFLKTGILPTPEYRPVDLQRCFAQIKLARSFIEGPELITDWLARIADSLETTALMLGSRGQTEFYDHSVQLYGRPTDTLIDRHTRVIDMAVHMEQTLSNLDFDMLVMEGCIKFLNAQQFTRALRPRLREYFGDAAPKVVLVDDLAAKVMAGSKRIRVRRGAEFTDRDIDQLMQHEALVHVATSLNGKGQENYPILGRALARTTEIQEGLAVFAEMMSGAMDPRRIRRLVNRVLAIQLSIDGADFKEVYDFYLERNEDPDAAYDNTRRIFRGGVVTGGAPFTKDMVYLNGLLRVHNFMRSVVALKRADLIRLLFIGKMDLEDVPVLAHMAHDGQIDPAQYMPPWVTDLRFLVSYLGYSGFLNQVKMPGFQAYYEKELEDVPVIWEQRE